MDFLKVLFGIAFAITFWLGYRNIITIITGRSLSGPLKPGHRLCHGISLIIYWSACLLAIMHHSFLPFIIGFVIEHLFRRGIVRAGYKAHLPENKMLVAVKNDNISELKNLIYQGADVNFHFSRIDGITILHEASWKGNVEILNYLLQNGADVNSKNHNGLTPLHIAAFFGKKMSANSLIENGADVNAKAKDNITPLHSAAVNGNLYTAELLINKGADVKASSSKDGSTPENFAKREGHKNVVDFLSR